MIAFLCLTIPDDIKQLIVNIDTNILLRGAHETNNVFTENLFAFFFIIISGLCIYLNMDVLSGESTFTIHLNICI